MKKMWGHVLIILAAACFIALIPLDSLTPSGESVKSIARKPVSGKPLKLAYVRWSTEIASTNVVKAVIEEKLGVACVLVAKPDARSMWRAVAEGEADAMVAAWLPDTHGHLLAEFKDKVQDLGPNLEGTRTGLVVPDVSFGRQTTETGLANQPYITVDGIGGLPEHAGEFKHRIIGIEAGAGITRSARRAMHTYGLEEDFELIATSDEGMTTLLADAIRRREWIVVTGWLPHWMFGRWKLKFLDDPENVFGGEGTINTIVRRGLRGERPRLCNFLDRFHWENDDIETVMVWNQKRYSSVTAMPGAGWRPTPIR